MHVVVCADSGQDVILQLFNPFGFDYSYYGDVIPLSNYKGCVNLTSSKPRWSLLKHFVLRHALGRFLAPMCAHTSRTELYLDETAVMNSTYSCVSCDNCELCVTGCEDKPWPPNECGLLLGVTAGKINHDIASDKRTFYSCLLRLSPCTRVLDFAKQIYRIGACVNTSVRLVLKLRVFSDSLVTV